MAGLLAVPASSFASHQLAALSDDPLAYVVKALILVGTAFVLAGCGMGVVGFYLKSSSQGALVDESNRMHAIASVFSNVAYNPPQTPLQPVATANPITDLYNFVGDTRDIVTNGYNDLTAGIGAIATALEDLPKALWVSLTNTPGLLLDAAVGYVGGAIADVVNFAFPYFIIFGIVLLVIGAIMHVARRTWSRQISPRLEARTDRFFDRVFGRILGPMPGDQDGPDEPPPAPPPPMAAAPPAAAPPLPVLPPAPPPIEPEVHVDVHTPTEDVQVQLGDDLTQAKDRMRAAIRGGAVA